MITKEERWAKYKKEHNIIDEPNKAPAQFEKKERNALIKEMYDSGKYSLAYIGKVFKIQRQRVYMILNRSKFKNRKYPGYTKVFGGTDNKCAFCGTTNDLSLDHIIPLSKGGANDISNFQILCLSCNKRKGSKILQHETKHL